MFSTKDDAIRDLVELLSDGKKYEKAQNLFIDIFGDSNKI
jgi:hypothetical protein